MRLFALCSLFLGCFLIVQVHLQAQQAWSDHFSQDTFSYPFHWMGDTSVFRINQDSVLQLDAFGIASPASIYRNSEIINQASWEFAFQLDFSPSSSNYAEIYLATDHPDPKQSSHAYFIKIGGISGTNDDISLYKKSNGQTIKLIDGRD